MISDQRKHELAVKIGAQRANDALTRTPSGIVYRLISGLDDIAPMPEHEKRDLAIDIANLIRDGHAVFVRPQDYVGKGDGEAVSTGTIRCLTCETDVPKSVADVHHCEHLGSDQ